MLNKFFLFIIFLCLNLFLSLFFLSCVGRQTTEFGSNIWSISSKAQITDKQKETTNNVSIDIFLKKQIAFRMEVSALFGYPVGSLLMEKSQIKYAIHPNKYFISGPFAARTLKPLFKQEVEPSVLWSVIHDESLAVHGFKCIEQNLNLQTCRNQIGQETVSVEIEKKESPLKKITIETNRLKMIWIIKSKELVKESKNETFVLIPPKEYKVITIK